MTRYLEINYTLKSLGLVSRKYQDKPVFRTALRRASLYAVEKPQYAALDLLDLLTRPKIFLGFTSPTRTLFSWSP